jgi:hypothetical protein
VRGTGYDVDHLYQPRASLSLSADIHLNVLNNSDDCMFLCFSAIRLNVLNTRYDRMYLALVSCILYLVSLSKMQGQDLAFL